MGTVGDQPQGQYQASPWSWGGGPEVTLDTHRYQHWCHAPLPPPSPWDIKEEVRKATGQVTKHWQPSWCWERLQREEKPQKSQQHMQTTRPGVNEENPQTQKNQRGRQQLNFLKSYTLMVDVRTDNRGSSTR